MVAMDNSIAFTTEPAGYILLVEDDEAVRQASAKLLKAAGFHVYPAPDYRVALQILEGEQPIDLILTDIVMPDQVNGLALARMARMRRRGVKIMYMTGYDIPGLEEQALGTILRKPVDGTVLIAEIKRALETARTPH
jgi:CheY-like chemotaxis protein